MVRLGPKAPAAVAYRTLARALNQIRELMRQAIDDNELHDTQAFMQGRQSFKRPKRSFKRHPSGLIGPPTDA